MLRQESRSVKYCSFSSAVAFCCIAYPCVRERAIFRPRWSWRLSRIAPTRGLFMSNCCPLSRQHLYPRWSKAKAIPHFPPAVFSSSLRPLWMKYTSDSTSWSTPSPVSQVSLMPAHSSFRCLNALAKSPSFRGLRIPRALNEPMCTRSRAR